MLCCAVLRFHTSYRSLAPGVLDCKRWEAALCKTAQGNIAPTPNPRPTPLVARRVEEVTC